MNLETVRVFIMTRGVDIVINIAAAIALWIIGRWLIGVVIGGMRKILARGGRVDPTLAHYLGSILGALLNLFLILAILQIFGVQTTSFAALLAGLGLAIGAAWGGLLAHFAAGIFMQVLRPFKVGDFVTAGGVTGTVVELGLFGTMITTPDNVATIVGNNKIFSDTISNYSLLPYRRVELTAKIANGVDPLDAISRLKAALAQIPNVAPDAAARCRDTVVHARRAAACRASVHQYERLLAGLFRHESRDRGDVYASGLSNSGDAVRQALDVTR